MPPKQQPSKKTVEKAKAKIVEVKKTTHLSKNYKTNNFHLSFLGQNIWFKK
jgi:hypothetical protein